MVMFSELDDYLSLEFLPDYWYDVGIGIASAMLISFDNSSWDALIEQCVSRPAAWQIRCAEIMDLVPHPAAEKICVKLMSTDNDDVVVAAADGLRCIPGAYIPESAAGRLQAILADGSPPVRAVLAEVLARLSKQ
jgi:hypothetical protein